MQVKLISITPDLEKTVAYCARVSNPANQNSDKIEKLLEYCIKNHHISIFEMGHMTLEITTTRSISSQLLRHRSFSFQEHSMRYSTSNSYEEYEARSQDKKNRQNSNDDLSDEVKLWFKDAQKQVWETSYGLYEQALELNIAKECARSLLPLNTQTRLYMSGSARSWITFLQVRLDKSTQLEHRLIAEEIQKIFIEQMPVISKALGWK